MLESPNCPVKECFLERRVVRPIVWYDKCSKCFKKWSWLRRYPEESFHGDWLMRRARAKWEGDF